MSEKKKPELICPAGTPASLRTAVDAGADAVYCGFQNATNARNFPGLNFTFAELQASVAYAHQRDTKVLLALNTFPPAGKFDLWKKAVDDAVILGVDAIIVADIGVAHYAKIHHTVRSIAHVIRAVLARIVRAVLIVQRQRAPGLKKHAKFVVKANVHQPQKLTSKLMRVSGRIFRPLIFPKKTRCNYIVLKTGRNLRYLLP